MEKNRYWTAVILGAIASIAVFILAMKDKNGFGFSLLIAYMVLSTVTSLAWWQGPPAKVFCFLTVVVGWGTLQFAFSLFGSGNGILFLIGIAIFLGLGSFCLSCIVAGITIAAFLAIFSYPVCLFSYGGDLY